MMSEEKICINCYCFDEDTGYCSYRKQIVNDEGYCREWISQKENQEES